ncbi:MAG: flagellar biosynthetic protein FliO [Planctomycetaceae bacterium]|nr:flagellar biosynthetic protein FliO [Planctomycetaceae bacterium]
MPEKWRLTTMLLFLLLSTDSRAQQLAPSALGVEPAGTVSPRFPTPIPPDVARNDGTPARPGEASHLAQPAIYQTPDRFVRPAMPTGHVASSAEVALDRNQTASAADSPIGPSPGDRQTNTDSGRDLGFPALTPPSKSRLGDSGTIPSGQGVGSVVTVVSSLAVVLGLFFVTAWLMRRSGSGGPATLPSDVFEVLGRASLNPRQQVHLVRCGAKLLLVSLTPDSAETLTEIDDPDEVTRLAGLCRANRAGSATAAFRQVLHQFAGQPAEPGFFGRTDTRTSRTDLPQKSEDFHG